jgi:hypothetical protein
MSGQPHIVDSRERVFGIGLPKTGQTSLLFLMMKLGFDAKGRQRHLSRAFYAGRYEEILSYYDQHDFFIDHPTCLMYKLAFERYGRTAKYILTLRSSPQLWFESLKRHNRYARPIGHKHRKWFGRYYPHGFDAEHISYYKQHAAEVRRFFDENGALDQLLVISVDEPESFKNLIAFLGVETDLEGYPHENRSDRRKPTLSNRFRRRYNDIVQPLYERCAPRLFPGTPKQQLPPTPMSR